MNTTHVSTDAVENNGPLALLLWALLTADVCEHGTDHVLLTWDREAGGTMQIRVPMSGHLPDFSSPALAPAITAISHLRDVDTVDDDACPEQPRVTSH